MTKWVQKKGEDINWEIGVRFTEEDTSGLSALTWEVKSIYPDGQYVELILPNKNNKTNYILQKYPLAALKQTSYWFKSDTIKTVDPMLKIINKIQYLDKRFIDRQQKKVLA